jgi:LCP family protein required for cell wall assembly
MTNLFDEQEFEEFADSTKVVVGVPAVAVAADGTVGTVTKTLFAKAGGSNGKKGRAGKKGTKSTKGTKGTESTESGFDLDFDLDAPIDGNDGFDGFDGDDGDDGDALAVSPASGRSLGRRALRAFGSVGLVFLLLLAGITGWGYLKFRAIPKIDVQADDFGRIGREEDSTVPYDDLFTPAESTETPNSPIIMTNTIPLTAPTVAPTTPTPTAPPSTQAKPETGSGVSEASEAASGTFVPAGAELLPVDTTPVTIDQATADALAEADAQDAAEVKEAKNAKDSKKPKLATVPKEPVVFEKVGPGPIVKVSGVEPFGGPGTQNFLMIGVDDRKVVSDAQKAGFGVGQVGGSRTDTILILRIDAANHKAWILSIPRDLWVPLATSGRPSRINAAYVKGAAELMNTIQQRLSIPIDHVVQVDFAGFQKIVNTVGGVEVCFDKPTRDLVSSLARREPGCQILDGNGATAYVRSRHYQQFSDGVWKEDPRSDLGRILRQQKFIRSVIKRTLEQSSNPLTMNAMLDDLKSALAIDKTFNLPETASLAIDLRSFDPNTLEAFTLPTTGARVNGAAVLKLNTKSAAALIGKFKGK